MARKPLKYGYAAHQRTCWGAEEEERLCLTFILLLTIDINCLALWF